MNLGYVFLNREGIIGLYEHHRCLHREILTQDISARWEPALKACIQDMWPNVQHLSTLHGPGSFTGLRLAFALGRGLTFQTQKSFGQYPSLSVLSACSPTFPVRIVMDSGGGWIWAQDFQGKNQPQGPLQTFTLQTLSDIRNTPFPLRGWGLQRLHLAGDTFTLEHILDALMHTFTFPRDNPAPDYGDLPLFRKQATPNP